MLAGDLDLVGAHEPPVADDLLAADVEPVDPVRRGENEAGNGIGGSRQRFSRPGNCTAETSTSDGRSFPHAPNSEAPTPAYGKQKRRRRADGFGLGQTNQEFASVRE